MQALMLAFESTGTFGTYDVEAAPWWPLNEKFEIKMAKILT